MTQSQKKHWARALSDAINMVTTTAAAIGLCGYGGYWLDNKLGTDRWLTVIGVLLGVATGIKVMWDKMSTSQTTISNNKSQDKDKS
ncbi:AtpZ/AtpI family protein [Syntrophomonas curvata]